MRSCKCDPCAVQVGYPKSDMVIETNKEEELS